MPFEYTLNEAILAATGGPSVNEGLFAFFGGTGTTLQDRERAWLEGKTAVRGTIEDMWFAHLDELGYPGTLNDKLLWYWNEGGDAGTPPFVFKDFTAIWAQFSPTAVGYRLNPPGGSLSPDNTYAGGSIAQIACLDDDTCYVQPVGGTPFPSGIPPNLWIIGVDGPISSIVLTWDGFDRYAGKVDGLYAQMQSNINLPVRLRLSMDGVEATFGYHWTIGQNGTTYGYYQASIGALVPTTWPDFPGSVIRNLTVNASDFLFATAQTGTAVPGCYTITAEIEGATGGYGTGNVFALYFSAPDYLVQYNALANYIRGKLGQSVGVNMIGTNNWCDVGTNGSIWGWNNGLGLGALGNAAAGFPFGATLVNFYVDAANNITISFNNGIGVSTYNVLIPGLNGNAPIALTGNGVTFTATVPGATLLFQSVLAQVPTFKRMGVSFGVA